MMLPGDKIESALQARRDVLSKWNVAPDAKVHCRELFAGHARLRSPFKNLTVDDSHSLLAECVSAMHAHGGRWAGAYVNAKLYPKELRLLEGETFAVTTKHLAGLISVAACTELEDAAGPDYQLAFDPDSTRIDWGLTRRMQATHFTRVDPRAIQLELPYLRLLDMADIGAYVLSQYILCKVSRETRKPWHLKFEDLFAAINMRTAEMSYRPNS